MRCDRLNTVGSTTAMELAGVGGMTKGVACHLEKLEFHAQKAISSNYYSYHVVRCLLSTSKVLRM